MYHRFLIAVAVTTLLTVAGAARSVSQGFLHASGMYIVDGNNAKIQLRGMGLGGWLVPEGYMIGTSSFANSPTEFYNKIIETVGSENAAQFIGNYRKYFVQRKDIDSLARWGFNSIRLPFHYAILSPSPGTYSDSGFAIIDSLLSWCESDHLYLILDMHCAPGGQNTINISDYLGWPSLWEEPSYQTWTAEIWKEIARRYATREWIGGYDLLNETAFSFPSGNKPLRDLFVRITDSIRVVDKNHLIFAEGNWYATDFTGLTPAWDANMAWSFHKYWNPNDISAFQSYLTLRANTNVPLWLGESGENSNQWFAECLFYAEHLNIGWSWWTLKKIESIACPLSVHQLPGYASLLRYWSGSGVKPTVDAAMSALNAQAAMLDAGQCTLHPDFLDALFRQPFSDNRVPFAHNVIPGVVYAVNYDMGKNGIAYYDFDYSNVNGPNGGSYNSGWAYRNDGVDIETSTDAFSNGYDVGWVQAGEFLGYTVDIQTAGTYSITLRIASAGSGGKANLWLDGSSLTGDVSLPGTGGWQSWQDVDLGVFVLPAGTHTIDLHETTDGYNVSRMNFTEVASAVQTSQHGPTEFRLEQNYPNPFNPSTTIQYTVGGIRRQASGVSEVRIVIYDVLGTEVATLVNARQAPGTYEVTLDGSRLASGVYFYRFTAGRYSATKAMLLER